MSESKDKYIESYIKSLAAVENEMEPLKEHKRELKASYVDNGWLTKEEISMAVKAFRLIKGEVDMDQLRDFYNQVSKTIGRG
mgnify:CR=1 FL=1|tara:strand:+ start:49 stop:294 length:246 start_codon:yes stop_codon:yes gene_type:complete